MHVTQASPASKTAAHSHLSSADLFRRCAAGGCDLAWREFVERFHGRLIHAVRRTLLRLGGDAPHEERVDDLVQEIYCRLLSEGRRRQSFRGVTEGQLMTYLQRVVASVVIDARREALAEKRAGGFRVAWQEWKLLPEAAVVADESPEERLLAEERRRGLLAICRDALGRQADATTARIARLALLEGWSSREIAERLDGRMGTAGIDSLIYRLRRRLAGRGIDLPRRDHRRGDRLAGDAFRDAAARPAPRAQQREATLPGALKGKRKSRR
jgi:RNA polymerase sigma factor (sigma-70 family)